MVVPDISEQRKSRGMKNNLQALFTSEIEMEDNFIRWKINLNHESNQAQTKDIFSEKWKQVERLESREKLFEMQRTWFLRLYGFESETDLARFLLDKKVILDAGCGLGYKSAWLARLAPHSTVIGVEIS